jgi:hypothetical protein
MTSRLARAIVRKYPAAWRERYEDEVMELVNAAPIRLGDLGELLHGLIVERWRELVTADDAPRRTQLFLGLLGPSVILATILLATAVGRGLTMWIGLWPSEWVAVGEWTLFSLFLVHVVVSTRWLFRRLPAPAGPSLLAGLLSLFVIVALAEWGDIIRFEGSQNVMPVPVTWRRVLFFWMVGIGLTRGRWPDKSILDAIDQRHACDEQLRLARAWVEGCHTTMASGLPAPLAEAEAQVERLQKEQEEATAGLAAKGYRAKFQRS